MKKLSISLFAILAVLFAVSSAFTARPKKTTNLFGEWYVIKSYQNKSLAQFEGYSYMPINDISNYEEATATTAQKFSQEDVDEVYCAQEAPSEFVCAVEFEGADRNCDNQLYADELDDFLFGLSPSYEVPAGLRFKNDD